MCVNIEKEIVNLCKGIYVVSIYFTIPIQGVVFICTYHLIYVNFTKLI